MIKTILFCCFLLIQSISYADTIYSIIELPEGFAVDWSSKNVLNNHGQVVGQFPESKSGAAIWDPQKGMTFFDSDNRSVAVAINDYGFVALGVFGLKFLNYETVLWNFITNEIKYGPIGLPYAINNSNAILIKNTVGKQQLVSLWDSSSDYIAYLESDQLLGEKTYTIDEKIDYSTTALSINSQGGILGYKTINGYTEFLLIYGSTYQLITMPGVYDNRAFLNDKNEVVALGYIDNKTVIAKWKRSNFKEPNKVTKSISENLKDKTEFRNCDSFNIMAFNNNGQVLLRTYDMEMFKIRLFLLTPIN